MYSCITKLLSRRFLLLVCLEALSKKGHGQGGTGSTTPGPTPIQLPASITFGERPIPNVQGRVQPSCLAWHSSSNGRLGRARHGTGESTPMRARLDLTALPRMR